MTSKTKGWISLIRSKKLLSMTYMYIFIGWGILLILWFNPKYNWDAGYPDLYNMIVGICEIIVITTHFVLITLSAGYFIIFPAVKELDTRDQKREWILYVIPFAALVLLMLLLGVQGNYWRTLEILIHSFMEEYGEMLQEL